ncbi:MAG TPA: FHA domain-containing protein, partial [Polyangia bacterium]
MSDFDKPATTVLSVGNRAVAVEVRGFAVEVVAGPDAGKSAHAKGRSLEIGTHATSDLVLTDEHVSRRHLRIDVEDNDCVLHDLGSTNGTRVGGVPVRVA